MKNGLIKIFGKSALPALVAGLMLAFGAPSAALAQGHGGHGGGGGSRSFSGSRGFSGGGQSRAPAVQGGRSFDRGRSFSGNNYRGNNYRGGYYRGGRYYGGGYYGGGLALGFGSPYYGYGYAPAPCGYYDQWGYWHADPACYNGTLGY